LYVSAMTPTTVYWYGVVGCGVTTATGWLCARLSLASRGTLALGSTTIDNHKEVIRKDETDQA
jgi:hypothetical protein